MANDKITTALTNALSEIEKKFGKGAVVNMQDKVEGVETIHSGSLSLDLALGGGYPVGRIVEIYGPESSGKTTLALHAIAEVQAMGGVGAFIDAEHAFDRYYAEKLGVDMSREALLFSQPDNGEQAFEIAEILIKSNAIDILVFDSVAAMTPKAEIEGDFGDSKMGLHARLMSQALRKLVAMIHKSSTTVIFINQLREKIGIMFGNPETTTGGNALKFYASQRLDIRRMSTVKEDEVNIANHVKVKVVKNKIAPPFTVCEFNIRFGVGIDKLDEIITMAVNFDIIKKSGSWFSYGDTKIGQGIQSVMQMLTDNPELLDEITAKVRSKI